MNILAESAGRALRSIPLKERPWGFLVSIRQGDERRGLLRLRHDDRLQASIYYLLEDEPTESARHGLKLAGDAEMKNVFAEAIVTPRVGDPLEDVVFYTEGLHMPTGTEAFKYCHEVIRIAHPIVRGIEGNRKMAGPDSVYFKETAIDDFELAMGVKLYTAVQTIKRAIAFSTSSD